jgi:hypothetical protein
LEVAGRLEAFNLYQPGQHVELAMRRTICNVILASGNPSPGHSCISTASATVPDPATELMREEEAKPSRPEARVARKRRPKPNTLVIGPTWSN